MKAVPVILPRGGTSEHLDTVVWTFWLLLPSSCHSSWLTPCGGIEEEKEVLFVFYLFLFCFFGGGVVLKWLRVRQEQMSYLLWERIKNVFALRPEVKKEKYKQAESKQQLTKIEIMNILSNHKHYCKSFIESVLIDHKYEGPSVYDLSS